MNLARSKIFMQSKPSNALLEQIGAYVINLDHAVERWNFIEKGFSSTEIELNRVSAVNGKLLPLSIPEFNDYSYRIRHGKRIEPGAVGCYLSHLKAIKLFLDSGFKYAMILEDDAYPKPNLLTTLERSLTFAKSWDLLRLSGFHDPHPLAVANLNDGKGTKLCVALTRFCGSGAYLVNRRGAKILLDSLLPMRVPFDHALDREWAHGFRAAILWPAPITQQQHDFVSQTNSTTSPKLPALIRYSTVFPYRFYNESCRVYFRILYWLKLKLRQS